MSQLLSRFTGLLARKPRDPAPAAQRDAFDRLGRIVREERARDGRPLPKRLTLAHG